MSSGCWTAVSSGGFRAERVLGDQHAGTGACLMQASEGSGGSGGNGSSDSVTATASAAAAPAIIVSPPYGVRGLKQLSLLVVQPNEPYGCTSGDRTHALRGL
jgi:hypothetical protein